MRHIRTLSRTFPSYHPRKGEPTFFVEKFWRALTDEGIDLSQYTNQDGLEDEAMNFRDGTFDPKGHTIRKGNRIKVGDTISFRVWSGKPYHSKQIIIAPDIVVNKTWAFKIDAWFKLDNRIYDGEVESHHELLERIALNDGLSKSDFVDWFDFSLVFEGQIICWSSKIDYSF